MARAATAQELTYFRSSGQWSRIRAAIYQPSTVYTARINQVFSTFDKTLELTYDGGAGDLADVLPDMTVFFGSTAGAWDKGIARLRSIDATEIYIGETSDISFADNDYITIVDDFALWARPILISSGVPYIDGGEAYSDQHTDWSPVAVMGPDRVVKLTGSSVTVDFDFSGSFVQGSTIDEYLTAAPGATGIVDEDTATPSITWDSVGWKLVYLTLTAATGKTVFGVRYVYIWDEDNAPEPVFINSLRGSTDSGGWEASITLFDQASLSLVRDHAKVIVFSEDHYGRYDNSTAIEIGPVEGAENILFNGWIARESIVWDSEGGSVSFTAYTAQFWLSQIPSWPFGVEFTTGTPAAWTEIRGLTIDLALLDLFLHATTAPRVMDIYLTGDTRYTKEAGSLASNLWAQINEIAFDQIFARPLVNWLNQLYVQIHPQLVPSGSRSWPTVFNIGPQDIERPVNIERSTLEELALLDLSGINVNASGGAEAFFSLAPGHSYGRYGEPEVQPKRLLSSQSQANTLAGLYRAWRNNEYKSIGMVFTGNNRLVDIAPRQKCTITISSSETKRGFTYSGGLIPTSIERRHDLETGFLRTEITFEGETFESRSENGDVPGSINISFPPLKPLPKLPDFGILLPGLPAESAAGPVRVLLHDTTFGLLYTEDFDSSSPTWISVNAGMTEAQYQAINVLEVCPNGAVYAGYINKSAYADTFLFRAPSIGATFVQQTYPNHLVAFAMNPLQAEQVALITNTGHGDPATFRLGANNSFSAGATFVDTSPMPERLSYGLGSWLLTNFDKYIKFNSGGTAVTGTGTPLINRQHIRASTTGITFHSQQIVDALRKGEDNLTSITTVNTGNNISVERGDEPVPTVNFHVDPTGSFAMTLQGGAGASARSSDGGATWVSNGGGLAPGFWTFRNAGTSARWVAAWGTVMYTENFGGLWVSKHGNLASFSPTLGIHMIRVIEES